MLKKLKVIGAVSAIALAHQYCSLTFAAESPDLSAEWSTAKTNLTRNFKDPEAAKFRDVFVYMAPQKDGTKKPIACGEVNGVNSYGGYVGYKKFYVAGTLIETEDDSSFGAMYNFLCGETMSGSKPKYRPVD